MITYDPFWKTLLGSRETTYSLITKHGISSNTIDRIRKGQGINTCTMNDLCKILNYRIENIAQYLPSKEDQFL